MFQIFHFVCQHGTENNGLWFERHLMCKHILQHSEKHSERNNFFLSSDKWIVDDPDFIKLFHNLQYCSFRNRNQVDLKRLTIYCSQSTNKLFSILNLHSSNEGKNAGLSLYLTSYSINSPLVMGGGKKMLSAFYVIN